MIEVIVGAVAPESLRVVISSGVSGVDLSLATGVVLVVTKKGEYVRQQWAASIVEQVQDRIVVNHIFQQGEVDVRGLYIVVAVVTTPSGDVRVRCGNFQAVLE
jgi:hypothetical protein